VQSTRSHGDCQQMRVLSLHSYCFSVAAYFLRLTNDGTNPSVVGMRWISRGNEYAMPLHRQA